MIDRRIKRINTPEKVFLKLFFLFLITNCFAQTNTLDVSLTIVEPSSPEATDGSIALAVSGSNSPYIYLLYDQDPMNGVEPLVRTEKIEDSNYSFSGLAAGQYFVCVIDSENNIKCKKADFSTE